MALSGFFTKHRQYIGVLEVMAVVVTFLFCLWALFWHSYFKYLLKRKPEARPNTRPPKEQSPGDGIDASGDE